MRISVAMLIFLAVGCSPFIQDQPLSLESLGIDVFGSSRELGYTNKVSGFLYTETNAEHRTGWQGWHVMSQKILDDYMISVDDRELLKSSVHLTQVYPHEFRRAYPSGAQETVTLLDSLNAIVVELSVIKGNTISIRPMFSGKPDPADFLIRNHGGILVMTRKNLVANPPSEGVPIWIGVVVTGPETGIVGNPITRGSGMGPAAARAALQNGAAVGVIVAGTTEEETVRLAQRVSSEYTLLKEQRKARMQGLLEQTALRTNDARFDKAIAWALLSMDALIMQQGRKGIFAGLPWFSNYWGRDTFISLPGATLVQGKFDDAREILRSFADWQDRNPASPTFGRIPNLVTPSSVVYNTADGTPRFIEALGDYVSYSGDTAFARVMYPVVKRAIDGSVRYRVDRYGLLTHGDAETWMDAVGPDGPWSPRGNRANDIQMLWYNQLLVSSWLAGFMNDESSFRDWFSRAEQVRLSFNRLFVDAGTGHIADHLNSDGTPDQQVRPNQLFTLSLIDNSDIRFRAFKDATSRLVYPHGVASLWQQDDNFHPYHQYAPFYVQDAAYHNGIVWTWLSGVWVSSATQYRYSETAWTVTRNLIRQILDLEAVGTLSELLDAVPREGESEPKLSGTFSQAWSLAEFLRNAYQDYLGVAVDAVEHRVELAPHLPPGITQASFNVAVGNDRVRVQYDASSSDGIVRIFSGEAKSAIDFVVTWRLDTGVEHNFAYLLAPRSRATLTVETGGVFVEDEDGSRKIQMNVIRPFDPDSTLTPIALAQPGIRPNLKALAGPKHRLLTNEEVKTTNPEAFPLFDETDPEGDDRGPGTYVYPRIAQLREGSLDLTGFSVAADDRNAYFTIRLRALSDPGWHPEYGFQLTMAAIAIDRDGKVNSGQRKVGRNTQYTLPASSGYERILFVGGGLRVEDSQGTVLGEYIPRPGDEHNPLGNAASGTISFAVPLSLIGQPTPSWRYVVLSGAQDDHGGAGLGDFRTVEAQAGEWVGGGKRDPGDSNVYDFMRPRATLSPSKN